MRYLLNEVLLRLIKPCLSLVLAALLYWIVTGPMGEPGSAPLALLCWISSSALILLLETGIV